MRSADKSGAPIAAIIGEEEVRNSTCALKFLKEKKDQQTAPIPGITEFLRKLL